MKILLIPFIVFAFSVILKKLVDLAKQRKRYLHYGGWPSSHASITTALTTTMGLEFGIYSAPFVISAVITAILLSDAIALRPLIGRQSKALNEFHHQHLPDHVGHTVFEVTSGIIISFFLTLFLFQVF